MASSGKAVVSAGLIIFRRISKEIHYLMLQASYGNFHWAPPKGKVHPGETERQAALRETEEEAGIRPDQMILYEQLRTELHYHVRNKPKTVIYGLAELKDPQFEVQFSREHQDMKWLSFEDAYNIAKNEGMRNALNEANKFISAS